MYTSLEEIAAVARQRDCSFYQVIRQEDCRGRGVTEEDSWERMKRMYKEMKQADAAYDAAWHSASGLVGGEGAKLHAARINGRLLCGDFIGLVMEKAVKMGESNACMRRIVAAPTAGACGVVPAVLLSMQEKLGLSENRMIEALYVAGGIGGVIANRACISGAAGGCQAEIGTASAMAAGAAVYLMEGDSEEILSAAALSLKNLMGLVCDPVAGLVEVPCVKRNAIGAVNALICAEEAHAGIRSKIPADEVIDAMRAVGKSMPENLKETGTGGIAATRTGNAVSKRMCHHLGKW